MAGPKEWVQRAYATGILQTPAAAAAAAPGGGVPYDDGLDEDALEAEQRQIAIERRAFEADQLRRDRESLARRRRLEAQVEERELMERLQPTAAAAPAAAANPELVALLKTMQQAQSQQAEQLRVLMEQSIRDKDAARTKELEILSNSLAKAIERRDGSGESPLGAVKSFLGELDGIGEVIDKLRGGGPAAAAAAAAATTVIDPNAAARDWRAEREFTLRSNETAMLAQQQAQEFQLKMAEVAAKNYRTDKTHDMITKTLEPFVRAIGPGGGGGGFLGSGGDDDEDAAAAAAAAAAVGQPPSAPRLPTPPPTWQCPQCHHVNHPPAGIQPGVLVEAHCAGVGCTFQARLKPLAAA